VIASESAEYGQLNPSNLLQSTLTIRSEWVQEHESTQEAFEQEQEAEYAQAVAELLENCYEGTPISLVDPSTVPIVPGIPNAAQVANKISAAIKAENQLSDIESD